MKERTMSALDSRDTSNAHHLTVFNMYCFNSSNLVVEQKVTKKLTDIYGHIRSPEVL
jgi:hypothetical protein